MNTNFELKTGNWLLVVGSHTSLPAILRSIGRLAEAGPVNVVDGGFAFNPYIVKSGNHAGLASLNRIQLYKAYSCRELLAALEALPAGPTPFVVLDFLTTFSYFFEDLQERKRLLRLCLAQLDRLALGFCGLVSVHLPQVLSQSETALLALLTAACQATAPLELLALAPIPARVF